MVRQAHHERMGWVVVVAYPYFSVQGGLETRPYQDLPGRNGFNSPTEIYRRLGRVSNPPFVC